MYILKQIILFIKKNKKNKETKTNDFYDLTYLRVW